MTATCSFRFEVRPDSQVVELVADDHSALVCENCLALLTVHRRIHHMNVERVIVEMARNSHP